MEHANLEVAVRESCKDLNLMVIESQVYLVPASSIPSFFFHPPTHPPSPSLTLRSCIGLRFGRGGEERGGGEEGRRWEGRGGGGRGGGGVDTDIDLFFMSV